MALFQFGSGGYDADSTQSGATMTDLSRMIMKYEAEIESIRRALLDSERRRQSDASMIEDLQRKIEELEEM